MGELNRRALGRALSRAADAGVAEALNMVIHAPEDPIRRIALTGAPGSGKSTLAGALARERLAAEATRRIGVLAIDPTSRYSGGAVLGDRIRMDGDDDQSRLFIRSLASRHTAEGLADNLGALIALLAAYGFDEALIETVGVGQIDCAVRELVDTVVLVINPESGDVVQAMKAGVMETADLYVVNKADLPGADRAVAALNGRGGAPRTPGWEPPVLTASMDDAASVRRLSEALDAHQAWRSEAVDQHETRRRRRAYMLLALLQRQVQRRAETLGPTTDPAALLESLAADFRSFADLVRDQGETRDHG